MSKKFERKIAVVTGGATGMCLAAAKRFVQAGIDHVFITGRRTDTLDAVMADIGKNVTAVQGDVANLADIDRLYDTVKKHNCKLSVLQIPISRVSLARHHKGFSALIPRAHRI